MRRGGFVLAFLAIYLIWGSTYLAIAVAVESIPPLAMMSVRSLAAGLILFAWSRRSAHTLDASAWRAAFIAGFLLFLLLPWVAGVGGAARALGVAALLGATTPLWLALIDWRWGTGRVLGWYGRAGLAVGFAGVALLVAPEWGKSDTGAADREPRRRSAPRWPGRPGRCTDAARRCRAMFACPPPSSCSPARRGWRPPASGRASGAPSHPARVTTDSVAALLYLIVFGSVVAFTAYVWLLRVTTASMVGTHAYVNPIVAVALGAALGRRAHHRHDDRVGDHDCRRRHPGADRQDASRRRSVGDRSDARPGMGRSS